MSVVLWHLAVIGRSIHPNGNSADLDDELSLDESNRQPARVLGLGRIRECAHALLVRATSGDPQVFAVPPIQRRRNPLLNLPCNRTDSRQAIEREWRHDF